MKFLCYIGIHLRHTIDLGFLWKDGFNSKKEVHLYYSVCKYCNDGHPLITGEW